LGRAAGCTLGVPVESWSPEHMQLLAMAGGQPFPPEDYWAVHPKADEWHHRTNRYRDYLRDGIREVPVDDDVAYTLLGLIILERRGFDFTTEDVARAWLKHLPLAWTAEEVTLKNLKAGVSPRRAGERGNPYQEWIGADIRSDPWGYAAAGWPERAAEFAWRDASLSHRRTGVYGAMFFAAAIAAAFVVQDPLDAIRIGLTEVPRNCRLADAVRWGLRIAPRLRGWCDARAAVGRRFPGMHHVHTINNACLTVFGLQLGRGDFTRTIGTTVAMGYDNDCTAATAGSILGAVLGIDGVPEHWWRPFRGRVRSYLRGHEHFTVSEIVRRFGMLSFGLYEDYRITSDRPHPARERGRRAAPRQNLLK
jgi:ADP-ribosylglycohydrolase